uniref:NADH-ubiquinone oxidoreductase chain 1 n=1 Tax=Megabeleses liriodendrovorax TaxID=2735432 RepID=A0A8F1B7X0_9HYME|nr:NADH dehydrogenase subunit 1 [Megabeleses liriodendrovorax]QWM93823.1 NADH dehydrogenase subunit 1 [Megabeleses liriodendrovorax]
MLQNEMNLFILSILMLMIMMMIGVAFLTLLERKVLGYVQIRKGPNKVSLMGMLQPFSDAIKLFSKELIFPSISNYYPYYFSPIFSLFLVISTWMIMPYLTNICSFNLSILFFLCCTSLGVYSIMISGWSSNSKYSLLGGLRSVAQTISYEVSLVMIMLSFIFMIESYSLLEFYYFQKFVWMMFIMFPLMVIWFVICLAETNRTPFDFAEGESELVSGFNVEYGAGGFSLIFMAEYSSILLMSMLFCVLFLGGNLFSLMFYLNLTFISFMFILVRGTLPRLRYDKLMNITWKSFLPISLNYLFFFMSLKLMFHVILI